MIILDSRRFDDVGDTIFFVNDFLSPTPVETLGIS